MEEAKSLKTDIEEFSLSGESNVMEFQQGRTGVSSPRQSSSESIPKDAEDAAQPVESKIEQDKPIPEMINQDTLVIDEETTRARAEDFVRILCKELFPELLKEAVEESKKKAIRGYIHCFENYYDRPEFVGYMMNNCGVSEETARHIFQTFLVQSKETVEAYLVEAAKHAEQREFDDMISSGSRAERNPYTHCKTLIYVSK